MTKNSDKKHGKLWNMTRNTTQKKRGKVKTTEKNVRFKDVRKYKEKGEGQKT